MPLDASIVPAPAAGTAAGPALRTGVWVAQVLVAAVFCAAGITKLMTPIDQLAAMMPWAGQFPPGFVRAIGLVDLAGGLGILLPSLTRVLPRVTLLAAVCAIVLQVLATGFHLMRGEAQVVPLNAALLVLLAVVLWGRARRAPIAPRA